MTHDSSAPIARQAKPKRRRKWGLYFVAAVAVLSTAGAAYQAAANSVTVGKYPPVGRMVSVGDYSMHIHCTGEGSPTVVFESGMGEGALSWSAVQPEISKSTRACSYDRSGYFWSDSSAAERTGDVIAGELMTLLHNAGEKGPYVLVGHSVGGLYVRAFSSRYPDYVAGMVLVDSSHEQQGNRLHESAWGNTALRAYVFLTRLGLGRIFGIPSNNAQPLPSDLRPAYQEMGYLTKNYATLWREKSAWDAVAATGLKRNSVRNDLPLVVLTQSGKGFKPDYYKTWVELQNELAALSSRSTHIVATSAGHFIQLDEPQLVIDAVSQVVSNARH
jgi:pimeloyl-ACP methyl ester carboxylesterase